MQEINQAQLLALLRREWEPGDHIAIYGPTKVGKTYLAADILALRERAVLISAKLKDRTILERYRGYKVLEQWKDKHVWDKKIILWPQPKELRDAKFMRPAIYACLNSIYRSGGWTVDLDDVRFLADSLGLTDDIDNFVSLVRSHGTSVISKMQRPFNVPQMCNDQASIWIAFFTSDGRDLDRIAEASGQGSRESKAGLRVLNKQLGRYDVLVVRRHAEPLIVRR